MDFIGGDISKGSLLLSTHGGSALLNQQPPTPAPTSLQTLPQDFPAGKPQEKNAWCDQRLAKAWLDLTQEDEDAVFLFSLSLLINRPFLRWVYLT